MVLESTRMLDGLTGWQMLWDVGLMIASLTIAFWFARARGEALLEKWAEARRVREWKVLGDRVERNIRNAIGEVYVNAQVQGQLDQTPGFNYRKWLTHLEEINSRIVLRGGGYSLTDADLWNCDADPMAILGATDIGVRYSAKLAGTLAQAQEWYHHTLPTPTRIQLSLALMAAQNASQAVKRLDLKVQTSKSAYDLQATTNLRAMIEFFKQVPALLELLRPSK